MHDASARAGAGSRSSRTRSQKIPRLRALVGADVAVEVDGGIDAATAPACRAAGASLFVAGSAIFAAADPAEAYRAIVVALGAEA